MGAWLAFVAASLAAFALLVVLAWAAPDGWEDDQGFHLGLADADPLGNRSADEGEP